VGAGDGGDAPGEAPAVAVEHRERPEVLRVDAHVGLEHLTDRVDPRPTVGVHDALGPARRARGVVDRERLVFVAEPALDGLRRARREEVLVGVARGAGVVHAHDRDARQVDRLHEPLELRVDEEEPRARVLEDVGDLVGDESRVDRDEDPAGGRHAEMRLEHRGDVRAEERDPVVLRHPRRPQRRGEAVDALLELLVGVPTAPVDDGRLLREDVRAAREEAHRGELGPIDVAKLVAHCRPQFTPGRVEVTSLRARAPPAERRLCRRNRILGGGSEGGRSPPSESISGAAASGGGTA